MEWGVLVELKVWRGESLVVFGLYGEIVDWFENRVEGGFFGDVVCFGDLF